MTLIFCSCQAQKITTVDATRQDWSGGIAGYYGTNFHFTLETFTIKNDTLLIDSIWIQNKVYALRRDTSNADNPNLKVFKKGNKLSYFINVGFSVNENHQNYIAEGNNVKDENHPAPIKYNGSALVQYHLKSAKKIYYYEIPFLKVLTPANYP